MTERAEAHQSAEAHEKRVAGGERDGAKPSEPKPIRRWMWVGVGVGLAMAAACSEERNTPPGGVTATGTTTGTTPSGAGTTTTTPTGYPNPSGDLVADHVDTDLASIPQSAIEQAIATLHIAYQHTSSGSQLITGMNALRDFPAYGSLYQWDDAGEAPNALDLDDDGIPGCDDLSAGDSEDENGDTPWVVATRELLDANPQLNVVMWAWSSIDGHDAQRYVDNMEQLIAAYPQVQFVFMTGHAEAQNHDLSENSVYYNNELIRQHCATHGRWLFDFADIEAYDPDGTYFWDQDMQEDLDYSGGNWAEQWCTANPGSELEQLTTGNGVSGYDGCQGCANSEDPQEANLNCVLKGRAAWWLWARLAGWGNE